MKLIRYLVGGTLLLATVAVSVPILALCLWLIDQEALIVTSKSKSC